MREGARGPRGLPLAALDLFRRGQEFGLWVRFSCNSDRPPLSPVHSAPWGQGGESPAGLPWARCSVNTLMGPREPGRNVGLTAPGD